MSLIAWGLIILVRRLFGFYWNWIKCWYRNDWVDTRIQLNSSILSCLGSIQTKHILLLFHWIISFCMGMSIKSLIDFVATILKVFRRLGNYLNWRKSRLRSRDDWLSTMFDCIYIFIAIRIESIHHSLIHGYWRTWIVIILLRRRYTSLWVSNQIVRTYWLMVY